MLTYAQCGSLDPFAIVDKLAEFDAECIIGRENHADGGLHLHAFVDFGRKYSTRNVRQFDVEGCHPNIVSSYGTPEKGYDYAIKEGDIVGGGLLDRPAGGRLQDASNTWTEIVAARSESEFWDLCQSLAPRALCTNFNSLRAYAAWRFPPTKVEYKHPENVVIDTTQVVELDWWVQENLGRNPTGGK